MVLRFGKVPEVLTEVTSDESQWQEDNCDNGQLLHALVLVSRNGVEDQVYHMVCRLLNLRQVLRDEHTMIVL